MILFGHLGFTLSFFRLFEKARYTPNHTSDRNLKIDYRYVFIGSILPDLIDKPIIFILSGSLHSGRVLAHTLLFSLLLFFSGLIYYRQYRNTSILALAGGCFAHLFLDSMWNYLNILFWPVYGLVLSGNVSSLKDCILSIFKQNFYELSLNAVEGRLSDPFIFIPEIIGGLMIVYFVINLYCQKNIWNFIKTGRVHK